MVLPAVRAIMAAVLLAAAMMLGPAQPSPAQAQPAAPPRAANLDVEDVVRALADFGAQSGRATGGPGAARALDYLEAAFKELGFAKVGRQRFLVPVRSHTESRITLADGRGADVAPADLNAVSTGAIPQPGISGPAVYAGKGSLAEMDGLPIEGAVVLMDQDSGRNWQHAASLGARALVYVDDGQATRGDFRAASELTPIDFPRFHITAAEAQTLFPGFRTRHDTGVSATLTADTRWERAQGQNLYCLIPGKDPQLAEQMVVVEAFCDASAYVQGRAPGADEAGSAAALVRIARQLRDRPPGRTVLLAVTTGHAQGLAGMRELLWALSAKGKHLRDLERRQHERLRAAQAVLAAMNGPAAAADGPLQAAIQAELKNEAEALGRRLMDLRLAGRAEDRPVVRELEDRLAELRRVTWSTAGPPADSPAAERDARRREALAAEMLPRVRAAQQAAAEDAAKQLACLASSRELRGLAAAGEVAASVSLHLSSHGDGLGAFGNQGFLYDIRPDRNFSSSFAAVSRVLDEAAPRLEDRLGAPGLFVNGLRQSRERPWRSWLPDSPAMGGELASLAGYVGLTLATVNDARQRWGTPHDLPGAVDFDGLRRQAELAAGLVAEVAATPARLGDEKPRLGFSTVEGKTAFLRQGELFAEQPAPGVLVQAYQDHGMFYAMTDAEGAFRLTGLGNKKVILGKVILEAYRLDPATGRVVWAVDKRGTGKNAYRIKMNRLFEDTRLTMFAARPLTAMGLLEPRTFAPLTRIDLFDGRRDAEPAHFWYSRIDTRDSTLLSVFLEPGAPLKFTLSDSVLARKLILTNAAGDGAVPPPGAAGSAEGAGDGPGYLPEEWPTIPATEHRAAQDMWSLLGPRIRNLEDHGVVNERIRALQAEGLKALDEAGHARRERRHSQFLEAARASLALAGRVYNDVEATQRDVLLGVLFYVALFVPFAYCMERLLIAAADIRRRIAGFLAILGAVIAVVYAVHPAFQLTYSPLVVILAFFILCLSALVSGIILLRFEREMAELRRKGRRGTEGVSLGQAFGAAFVIGVGNLRRRPVRTALTVITLVILTFTIMSFTAVRSVRQTGATSFRTSAPYAGVLLRKLNWAGLPPEALAILQNAFGGVASAPRVWLEGRERTSAPFAPLSAGGRRETARAVVGLDAAEPQVSGLDATLVGGRWLKPEEDRAMLLPRRLAERLGLDPRRPDGAPVRLWGMSFQVVGVFDEAAWRSRTDLDDETVSPVTFPSEAALDMAELEAMESEASDAIEGLQGRYEHVDPGLMAVIPARTALALGGQLKAVAARPQDPAQVRPLARRLVDRFGLTIFSGETTGEATGTFLFHASDSIDYSGAPNILAPILIAALIVLNTMISSVYERKREIAVYTSVGMAPTHVSFLFVAEAVAFAVISTVLGYLLAQAAAKLLAGTALWGGMTANYSSLAGVAAMLLVMGVVLASAVYPSMVAARIAIPDVNRSWTMPDAQDDRIVATLPFLLKYDEQQCVGGYLLDYYQAHEDSTHGLFSAGPVNRQFACPVPGSGGPSCLRLDFQVWLAPFDFGVKQRVELIFCPADISPEFLKIEARITREAGEAGAWKRINKGFLDDLRRQLLAWRSLDGEQRLAYEGLIAPAGADAAQPQGGTHAG